MSILNKYKRWVPMLIIDTSNQLDMVLSQDHTQTIPVDTNNGILNTDCLISYIDMNNPNCIFDGGVTSLTEINGKKIDYENSIADFCELNDIKLTGIDNGLVSFDKIFGYSNITNKEFYKLMTEYKMFLESGDTRLTLYEVTGNTGHYTYGTRYVDNGKEKYYALSGGFLQGFFKMHGFNYQTLPQHIENTWNLEFVLRPRNYEYRKPYLDKEENGEALNLIYPDNKGIFFYMGTRSENKFSQFYKNNMDSYPIRQGYEELCNEDMNGQYFHNGKTKEDAKRRSNLESCLTVASLYIPFEFLNYEHVCGCGYTGSYKGTLKSIVDNNNNIQQGSDYEYEDYVIDDIDLSDFTINTTFEGKPIDTNSIVEFITDNKYLLFNRAKHGYTAKTFEKDADYTFILSGITREYQKNAYLLFNRTKNGYTTKNIDNWFSSNEYQELENGTYDITKDIIGNAFALQIKDDGSIGYKYLVRDCESEHKIKIESEFSYPGIITDDKWNVVNVMFSILNGNVDNCGTPYGKRKMRIYVYVNGMLKLVSKELDEFNFHELDDSFDKQEGVPYNISLGGGSQGLMESIWTNRKQMFKYVLPIEQNFAGTFIGDIRSFKFYNCKMESAQIKNNYYYEMN